MTTLRDVLHEIVDLAGRDDVERADEVRRMIHQLEEREAKTLTFEPADAGGHPRMFAGMWRPPTHNEPALLDRIAYEHQRRDAWQRGDFDRPLYVLDEPE